MERITFNTREDAEKAILKQITVKTVLNETEKAICIAVRRTTGIRKDFNDITLEEKFFISVYNDEVWIPKSALSYEMDGTAIKAGGLTIVQKWFIDKNLNDLVEVL